MHDTEEIVLDQQTIDQRATQEMLVAEQHIVLERLEQISATSGYGAWSDDHEMHMLMDRYEHTSWSVASQLMRER